MMTIEKELWKEPDDKVFVAYLAHYFWETKHPIVRQHEFWSQFSETVVNHNLLKSDFTYVPDIIRTIEGCLDDRLIDKSAFSEQFLNHILKVGQAKVDQYDEKSLRQLLLFCKHK